MDGNKILVVAEKETFLVRVLIKKIQEAEIDVAYVPYNVNAIHDQWESASLITCYMDTGERVPDDVIRFLSDKMMDDSKQIILIGDKTDLTYAKKALQASLVYKEFERPLDNAEYLKTVSEIFNKIEAGEFRKSILVVDDDASYLGLVREWLREKYRVSMVTSGLQAIKWLGKNKADLILLDHEMPVTTGPQILEMLRSDEETKRIPVIFLTGKSDKESVMQVVALKPEGYFLKNIDRKELMNKLDEFFASRV